MRTFITTSGLKWRFQDAEPTSVVTCIGHFPTNADIAEYVDFIREERMAMERGPQVVRDTADVIREQHDATATLLVNGGFFRVEQDAEVPQGYMWIRDARNRLYEIALEGDGPRTSPDPSDSTGEAVQVGAAQGADTGIVTGVQHVAQQVEGE